MERKGYAPFPAGTTESRWRWPSRYSRDSQARPLKFGIFRGTPVKFKALSTATTPAEFASRTNFIVDGYGWVEISTNLVVGGAGGGEALRK